MLSSTGATIDIPLAKAVSGAFQRAVPSLDEERNLHCSGEEDQMESGFPRRRSANSHNSDQIPTLPCKIGPPFS
jgi:hypothetical protein